MDERMRGREGKFFVCKRYIFEEDRWGWFATCWVGDHWYVYESYTLPMVIAFAMMKAREYAEIS